MNIWQKLTIGAKFLFGSFESAVDYALGLLNKYLARENVAGKVQKSRKVVETVLGYLRKYEAYCPAIWEGPYKATVDAVQCLCDALADGEVSGAELQAAVEGVKIAIGKWMED